MKQIRELVMEHVSARVVFEGGRVTERVVETPPRVRDALRRIMGDGARAGGEGAGG